jgi:3-hydroxymyristoyl/3-hydroxydecanoyl-(acyl carrier protein) dehydratase
MGEHPKIIEVPGGTSKEKIENFLKIKLPDSIVIENDFINAKNREGIEELVYERAPFMCIERIILLEGKFKRVISTANVTFDMCDGHFPGRPMIPLLIYSKIIALTGEILVSWLKGFDFIPLAIKADNVRSESRKIISPPALIITEAIFLGEKFKYCWIMAKSYVGNENVAAIDKLIYFVLPQEQFFPPRQ